MSRWIEGLVEWILPEHILGTLLYLVVTAGYAVVYWVAFYFPVVVFLEGLR